MSGSINFGIALKKYPQKGNLAWEYNPFRNYRLNEDSVYYKNEMLSYKKFIIKYGTEEELIKDDKEEYKEIDQYSEEELKKVVKSIIERVRTTEVPIVYQKGQLVDLDTEELNFDLNHPVEITPYYSYDDSVDLIINDGKNNPKIINSRFSAIGKNKYQIVDRTGENDTNIYDRGNQFDVDTSLYKRITTIPELEFLGVSYGGNLKVGAYHFYFKYVDDDGNESDFIAESGLVQIFIGNTPQSIHSGFRDENAFKKVRFIISNISSGYEKLVIYYTKATSDVNQNITVSAHKIIQTYPVNYLANNVIDITGFEESAGIPIDEINTQYQIYDKVNSQAICQNMLFFGNVSKPDINYKELQDCALRFIPELITDKTCDVNKLDTSYLGNIANTYYNPTFTYNNVGYWDDEIYRFGIVFILSDNTLSPVFNVRGGYLDSSQYTKENFYQSGSQNRNYISWNSLTYQIISESNGTQKTLENSKGVVYIPPQSDQTKILGIKFSIQDFDEENRGSSKELMLKYLKDTLNINGFFFVRQKRIPTTLCQAYTIGIDKQSHTPVLPINANNYIGESFIDSRKYYYNSIKDDEKDRQGVKLTHAFGAHKRTLPASQVEAKGAICPEYDVNQAYLNSLFTGADFLIREVKSGNYLSSIDRNFYVTGTNNGSNQYYSAKILGVEDNVKLVAIGSDKFSSRAGEESEAWRFNWLGSKTTVDSGGFNVLRGCYGNYLGITGYNYAGSTIAIKIPGYNTSNMPEYFSIRYNDNSSYYAVSNRYNINYWDKKDALDVYRGDCYICKVTHRVNRNFKDPSTPTNNDIVDPFCWAEGIQYEDGNLKSNLFDRINLGDVNAINLGMWVTNIYRCNMNLSVRSLDESNVQESSLMGHGRGFYPYYSMSAEASYKIPEAYCYNKGFEKSVSERYNVQIADAPAYKNNYSARIAYSNIRVNSFFQNSFRTFLGQNYRDYPMNYGSITKLIEFKGALICILEHGIYRINVNERVLASNADNPVYINTANVLPENPQVISDIYGSQWKDSIVKSEQYIYGVDTVGKKIWRTDGSSFEVISDMQVQKFLNSNISLTERELEPILGIRNVKTHYNRYKNDVMFTFYDNLEGFNEKVWNLCWNETLKMFVTFYSWVPSFSENIYNMYFSFNRDTSKWISKLGNSDRSNNWAEGVTLDNVIFDNNLELITEESISKYEYDSQYKAEQDSLPLPLYKIGTLSLENKNLIDSGVTKTKISYSLERDNYGNYKKFRILREKYSGEYILCTTDPYANYCTEKFLRNYKVNDEGSGVLDSAIYVKDNQYLYVKTISRPFSIDEPSNIVEVWYVDSKYNDGAITLLNDLTNSFKFEDYNKRKEVWDAYDKVRASYNKPSDFDLYTPVNQYKEEKDWNRWVTSGKTNCAADLKGRRISWIPEWTKSRKVVYLLNIRANITLEQDYTPSLEEFYATKNTKSQSNGGFYESVVAVIPKYNMQFLTTDFWKHGRAGIIDIQEPLYPTKWYNEQHPFEFEFVINENIDKHKIFDSLQIISNNAEPESFHYEIIGDSYEFAKDKKNMYIRQEATKELYQYNGADITYNSNYKTLEEKQRPIYNKDGSLSQYYEKSTILPLNYFREDHVDSIYDSYTRKGENDTTHDYRNLAGGEIGYDENTEEFSIINHCMAVDIGEEGLLRGNMRYKEDSWYVQINPLNIIQNNEDRWHGDKVPYELNYFPPTEKSVLNESGNIKDGLNIPDNIRSGTVWEHYKQSESKLKDKFIKVRIRYKGNKLAIIRAIYTLYSISFA